MLLLITGNINPLDKTNSTPLSNALSASQQEVVSFLRSQGAVASAHDEEGMRLIQAASSGDAAAVKHLLERGVSPAVADYGIPQLLMESRQPNTAPLGRQ
jgi:ankyrin repeat protein